MYKCKQLALCSQYETLKQDLGKLINKDTKVASHNGPSPKRPHFRLKRPQAKKKSVKTAPYEDFMLKSRRES